MSVYLVDTTTKRDILINDVLVGQGLALFVSDTPEDTAGEEMYQLERLLPEVSECVCVLEGT